MQRNAIGTYVNSIAGGKSVRAFVPAPLPPIPMFDLIESLQFKLETAILALGRLDSISLLLPNPKLFLYTYVRQEAVLSSQIEGTQSSISELMLFELDQVLGVPFNDVVEVSNYVAALEHGISRLNDGFPLCNRLLREVHTKLMATGRGSDKAPGEFRRVQNWVGGTRPGNATFIPPPPQYIDDCMAQLENFIHYHEISLLLKIALVHVQFETIHPFLDGNGRLGRLLIALLLHDRKILKQPLLYLSVYFKAHRTIYYDLLNHVRTTGDWESWIDFFLEGIEKTANTAIQTAQNLIQLFQYDAIRIQKIGRSAINVLRIFDELQQHPITTLPQLCLKTNLSFSTASKAIKTLVLLGIVVEYTKQRRNRIFVYNEYLRILNES